MKIPYRPVTPANDVEAISLAEVMRGPLDAELLDVEALRIVKYLPNDGGSRSGSLNRRPAARFSW